MAKKSTAMEEKQMLARRKKTEASLKRLTATPPPLESTDTSEAEENVTAAVLSTITYKERTEEEKAEKPKGPMTRARRNKNA